MRKHHNIKQVAPRYNTVNSGVVSPKKFTKLFESQKNTPIIYRSSWEKHFIEWCENCNEVKHWGSECFPIRYIKLDDRSEHIYYPDFILEMTNGNVYVIEIKPYSQTIKPKSDCSKWALNAWIKNCSKWVAAKKVCNEKGFEFKIVTERTLDKLR